MAGSSNSQGLILAIQRKGFVWTDAGVQGPNVAVPSIRSTAITTQQQPYHPKPFIFNFTPIIVRPVIRVAITRQEQPRQAPSIFGQPMRTVSVAPEVVKWAITRQEQPPHPVWPRPPVQAGTPTNSEFCQGYIIGN